MYIPQFNYLTIALLIASITFFVRAARFDNRSEFVWGLLSLGSWMLFTSFVSPGIVGGLASQILLFAGIAIYDCARERRQLAQQDDEDRVDVI